MTDTPSRRHGRPAKLAFNEPAPAPAPEAAAPASHTVSMSVEEQVEAMKKLKELADIGILSQEEFDAKKHEILGL